jgi:putative nucleotidyltransferase with HDIG domain
MSGVDSGCRLEKEPMAARRVLVVERNPKIGELIAGQLREKGYDVVDVRHGAEAALSLREQVADLILMDNQIVMGGIKTARLLRLHPKFQPIPIIIGLPTDTETSREVVVEGQQNGLNNYLRKPITLCNLQQKISEIIEDHVPEEQPTFMQIREEIRLLADLPVMPEAHNKLLQLLNKPDTEVDMKQVARTLELDPSLSANVMRVCRSAFFGFQGSLMQQALSFLGIDEIRAIVQTAVIHDIFDDEAQGGDGMSLGDLWKHSLAVGLVMELLGKSEKNKTHFLLGVLHDIGKAIFKFRFPDHFSAVTALIEEENCSMLEAEKALLGITHAECGGELAVHWDLPPEVRTAIASHHSPTQTSQHRRLAAMVNLADIAVRTMKIGFAGDNLIPQMDMYAKRSFPNKLSEILDQQEEITEQVEAILGGTK